MIPSMYSFYYGITVLPTQYLSAMVDQGNIHGQARAFSALAGIYEETGQITKAEDYYRKVYSKVIQWIRCSEKVQK